MFFSFQVASLLSLKCLSLPRHLLCTSNKTQFSLTLSSKYNQIKTCQHPSQSSPASWWYRMRSAQTSTSVTPDFIVWNVLCGSHWTRVGIVMRIKRLQQQRCKMWHLSLIGLPSCWVQGLPNGQSLRLACINCSLCQQGPLQTHAYHFPQGVAVLKSMGRKKVGGNF